MSLTGASLRFCHSNLIKNLSTWKNVWTITVLLVSCFAPPTWSSSHACLHGKLSVTISSSELSLSLSGCNQLLFWTNVDITMSINRRFPILTHHRVGGLWNMVTSVLRLQKRLFAPGASCELSLALFNPGSNAPSNVWTAAIWEERKLEKRSHEDKFPSSDDKTHSGELKQHRSNIPVHAVSSRTRNHAT